MRKGWKIDKCGWRSNQQKSNKERVDKINKVLKEKGKEAAQAEFLNQIRDILG